MMDAEDGFMGEVFDPEDDTHEPPVCDECCRDVAGEVVRVTKDRRLLCDGCDPSISDHFG